MCEFSGLYKEMCEKAERLQKEWIWKQPLYYCERGDREDGFEEFLSEKEISEKSEREKEDFKSKNIWLPKGHQIKNILLLTGIQGQNKITLDEYYEKFLKNEDKMREINGWFKGKVGDINDAKALIFYMEENGMTWHHEEKEWVEKKFVSMSKS